MKHVLVLTGIFSLVVSGCRAEWILPAGYILNCTTSSDCPGEQTCNTEIGACVDSNQPICGNGQTEFGEDCDLGTEATAFCDYGNEDCIVCVGLDYEDLQEKAIDQLEPCKYGKIKGAYCGDGIVQQRGLKDGTTLFTGTETDGTDTREWEGCDLGDSSTFTPIVACDSLHPLFGGGTASCKEGCDAYDTSQCENQNIVFVPGGPFVMGCSPEVDSDCDTPEIVNLMRASPAHLVVLGSFIINTNEVTVAEYKECVAAGVCQYTGPTTNDDPDFFEPFVQNYNADADQDPINFITYDESQTYCAYHGMQLPTEAQWEKAARGTDGRTFPWGFNLPTCNLAVTRDLNGPGCGEESSWPVGSKPAGASPYGALDLAGNVWEWTVDWLGPDYYAESPTTNPVGPDTGSFRVIRGGSWGTQDIRSLRSALRYINVPIIHNGYLGFRCAQSAE